MRSQVHQSLLNIRPYLSSVSSCGPPVKLAFHTLTRVWRNSSLYIAVGWFFGYCFTLGNLFSDLPPGEQSCAAFSAANISWFNGVFSMCMIIIMAAKLQREQFFVDCAVNQVATGGSARTVTRRLTILQCVYKLLWPMAPHLVLALLGAIGSDFIVYSVIPNAWHGFKPILYIAFFWGLHVLVVADIFARRIFKTETVRGLVVSTFKLQTEVLVASVSLDQTRRSDKRSKCRRCWIPSHSLFFRVYAQNLPTMVFALIAIVYVHVISEFLKASGNWELYVFGCGSIALKLALQELAKHIMVAVRLPVSRRVMVALVSTPTILVDTQVRMLLLRQTNLNISLAGTVLLAGFEIVVRAIKSIIVRRQTRVPTTTTSTSQSDESPVRTSQSQVKVMQVMPATGTISTNQATADQSKNQSRNDGTGTQSLVYSMNSTPAEYMARRFAEERRRKIRVLHVAEIYADMYAEYIAIGCSYAILYFYRNHPQYQFSLLLSDTSGQTSDDIDVATASRESQLLSLGGIQVIVEVVVDFLACVFEAAHGVEFKSFNQNDPFLIFFLAMLTFSNVAISAGMYMH